jgi:hypothetical protein
MSEKAVNKQFRVGGTLADIFYSSSRSSICGIFLAKDFAALGTEHSFPEYEQRHAAEIGHHLGMCTTCWYAQATWG